MKKNALLVSIIAFMLCLFNRVAFASGGAFIKLSGDPGTQVLGNVCVNVINGGYGSANYQLEYDLDVSCGAGSYYGLHDNLRVVVVFDLRGKPVFYMQDPATVASQPAIIINEGNYRRPQYQSPAVIINEGHYRRPRHQEPAVIINEHPDRRPRNQGPVIVFNIGKKGSQEGHHHK